MAQIKRFIIVRPGAQDVFERIQREYAGDPETAILYDRRAWARRTARQPTASNRRRGERRFPFDARIIAKRGYYVIRARQRPALT